MFITRSGYRYELFKIWHRLHSKLYNTSLIYKNVNVPLFPNPSPAATFKHDFIMTFNVALLLLLGTALK